MSDGARTGQVSHPRLHTLLALLGRAPPHAAGDDNDNDVEEEKEGADGQAGSHARTCVIVATTALDDMTLARLGLLPKCVTCECVFRDHRCMGTVWALLNVNEQTLFFLGSPGASRCPSSRRPSTRPA